MGTAIAEGFRHELIDAVRSSTTEILVRSERLDIGRFGDGMLLDAFAEALSNGAEVWILVEAPVDWEWLDAHPLGRRLSAWEEKGVYVRTTMGTETEAEFVVCDGMAYGTDDAASARDGFLADWRQDGVNLMGCILDRIDLRDIEASQPGFRCLISDLYPGVCVEFDPADPKATERLERTASIVMGGNHARRRMRYSATVSPQAAWLDLVDRGEIVAAPARDIHLDRRKGGDRLPACGG